MTYPLKPGYMNCVLEKLFSASRQVLLPPCSFTANIEEQRVTNRVIYDAAGTGRSCQNDNNRVKMSTELPESSVLRTMCTTSSTTTVNVIDDLFDY